MNFAALFLLFAATMLLAVRHEGRRVYVLFAVAMLLTIALYVHHASSKLPLSF